MKRVLILIGLITVLTSCEKVLFDEDQASSDPFVNFDYLWSELDRKYSYFELKAIDWEAARITHRARLSADMTEEELFEVLADLLNALRDDHSNLIAPFNTSRYNIALQHPPNFFARTLQEHVLPDGRITGSFYHGFLADEQIGYIRYASFSNPVSAAAMNHMLTRYADTKGLILDLRANGGGNVFNVTQLLQRFNPAPKQVGNFITRNGPQHTDFGPPQTFTVAAHTGVTYTKPIAVLIDRSSYSATTMFAVAAKAFENMTLFGDSTGGGGGLPNGGQLPNGWMYRFSISQLLDLQGNNYAEDGVEPDIEAAFDWSDLTRDEIIERAIEELL